MGQEAKVRKGGRKGDGSRLQEGRLATFKEREKGGEERKGGKTKEKIEGRKEGKMGGKRKRGKDGRMKGKEGRKEGPSTLLAPIPLALAGLRKKGRKDGRKEGQKEGRKDGRKELTKGKIKERRKYKEGGKEEI